MKNSTHVKVLHLFFSILITINRSVCTRPLVDTDYSLTFFINDMLSNGNTSTPSVMGNGGHIHIPFFNPKGGASTTGEHVAPFGPSVWARPGARIGWLSFLTSLKALESGNVTVIDEELSGRVAAGVPLVGKVQGIYVTSAEDSHMMAMRAIFGGGKSGDSLRFFGEHRRGISESHIAVVGGTGSYNGANGFAVVTEVGEEESRKRKLKFTVHIKVEI